MVHDPDNATNQPKQEGSETCTEKPIKYVRWFPKFKRDDENGGAQEEVGPRVAHLHLAQSNRFGTGNHSYVYRAPLTLPAPLSAHSPTGQVTVAAKLAYPRCTAHNLLRNEARVYDSFPKYVQEEYCGYNIVPQCRFPVPATAIVPKFFGYYLPVDERGNVLDNHHDSCSEEKPCSVKWPSPILLMEECGKPVEPSKFTLDQRTECFSLILRLRHMDLYQGSFYVRNIMIQPGPLTLPPAERSYDRPSFRIIDFGRAASWEMYSTDPARLQRRIRTWQADRDRDRLREGFLAHVGEEVWRARGELLIDDFTF
ncbi:hypothetical protein BD414DRAFT_415253 [Trametes punicea]|nr:hypothetical protein BD414DRAFT_415253 [Trametes punicea]